MVRVRSSERLPVRVRCAVLLAVMSTAGGCTMCPDPFDYSGPVPNGSPPQNDFRARSGGILPLGAAPRPWPQVVRAAEAGADAASDDGENVTVETVSVLQAADAVAGDDGPLGVTETSPAAPSPEPALEPVPADGAGAEKVPADAAAAPEQPVDGGETSGECGGAMPAPQVGETPGWRPRR
jgi:hypothetical protein